MTLEDDEQQPKTIKASHSSSSSSKSIPLEIIFEILSRLPVESLLRCKSVCKSWLSLISDPHFIKYHLSLSTTNHHYANHHLLVCTYVPVKNLQTCPLYDALYDPNTVNRIELDFPMKDLSKTVSIVGSCNGLICVIIEPSLFIWNPSTRKSIQLPDRPRSAKVMLLGFGYDESSNDYKVVEITCSIDHRDDNVVMIYSSKNGNRKEIGGFPHYIWLYDSDILLNGALHWLANQEYNYDDSWIIVSLDLGKETYGQVLLPVDYEDDINLRLGMLGDSLCVLCDYSRHQRFCADVWVMKVYGVKDSWFKLVSIPYNAVTIWGDQFWAPLCVSDDGKVLLRLESRLIVFDSKDDSALEIQKLGECYKACTFVESLVSPAGYENLL